MEKEKSLLYKSGIFALVCVGLVALAGVYMIFTSRDDMNKKTLPAQGKGEVKVVANKAKITSNFEFEGKTAEEASKLLASKMEEVKTVLDKEGVKEADRKTISNSNNPKYEQCDYTSSRPNPCFTNPKIIGHTAAQTLEISFDIKDGDKSSVEKVLGIMPSLGAKTSNGPDFVVDNKEAIKEARQIAIKDAREKAEAIASALGMRLGDVMYYSENNGSEYPIPMYSARAEMKMMGAMDMAKPVSVPVELGSDKVTVTVDITYELE
jgi:uncharacterized protein